MEILRAYKTELDPNNKQRSFFGRCCGASRYVYNWGLAEWECQYEAGNKPSAYSLKKQFNAQKDRICPWIRMLPYCITESAFANLGSAFQRYFKEKKDGTVTKRIAQLKKSGKWATRYAKMAKKGRSGYRADPGYPKFKKRGRQSSFQMRGYKTQSSRVWLGRSIGWVRLKEHGYIPDLVSYKENGGATYATISERAGRWYISVQVQEQIPDSVNDSTLIVGVDFGLKSLAVCSDGTVYENPRPLREAQRKLSRLNRELDRRTRSSQSWKKTKDRLARQHARISAIRKHTLHQISHDLVVNKHPATIVIEDLNVQGMQANHRLAQAISDVGFYELRRQIEYKAQWHGVEVIVADRWYASSKTCSNCSNIKEDLTLADREFICSNCGLTIDRDLNAAMNLAALGEGRNTPGLPVELECSEALL